MYIHPIRREFRALLGNDEHVSSLKDNWQCWMEKLVKLAQSESASRLALKKILDELTDADGQDGEFP